MVVNVEQRLRTLRSLAEARISIDAALRDELVEGRNAEISLAQLADAVGLSVSRVHAIIAEHSAAGSVTPPAPVATSLDTVIVAARRAYDLYLAHGIYRCQAGRSFRPVDYVGFYKNRAVQPQVGRILLRRDHVELSAQNAASLRSSGDTHDAQLADAIDTIIAVDGYLAGDRKQVFLLSPAGDPQTITLPAPIPHHGAGRGSAYTQGQRYTSSDALRANPTSTEQL
jgi:hypothetical protein